MTRRTTCRSCGSKQLKDILDLGEQHLSDFTETSERPKKYPLELILCETCTLLQLAHTTPPAELYTERYGYRSGINDTIREDLQDIVLQALKRAGAVPGDVVVDIGANDGTLLSQYPDDLYRVGFEPVKKLAEECQKHADQVVNDYFHYVELSQPAKIITVISCFYDLEDPNTFVADLARLLHPEGVIVIQQNYLAGMLARTAFDNIVHEHLEYYSLTSLEHLLNRHGLEVFDVEENAINGGSFRVYVRHMDRVKKMRNRERDLRLNTMSTYSLFAMRVREAITKLKKFVTDEVKAGKTVYVYGASTRGNTLLQAAGLGSSLITAAVERNPEKWGKKIASVGIPIISEDQARQDRPDYMLVLPWFFKNEFLKREEEYLKQGGKFIFPLPEFSVVGYEDIRHHPERAA